MSLNIHLTSPIYNKKFFKYNLKNQIVTGFITVLVFYAICIFVIPAVLSGRTGRHSEVGFNFFTFIVENQFVVISIGAVLAISVLVLMGRMRDKHMIVSIIVDNSDFLIKTRRPKLNSLKDHSGNIQNLKIVKDKIRLSPIESTYLCYKFFNGNQIIGVFIPDHFAWEQVAKRQIVDVFKKLNPFF